MRRHDEEQRAAVQYRASAATDAGQRCHVTLAPLPPFWQAEEYHQQCNAKQRGGGGGGGGGDDMFGVY